MPPAQLFRGTDLAVKAPGTYILTITTRAVPHGFTERLTIDAAGSDGRVHEHYQVWRIGANDKVLTTVNY
jgi:hypothetical protein